VNPELRLQEISEEEENKTNMFQSKSDHSRILDPSQSHLISDPTSSLNDSFSNYDDSIYNIQQVPIHQLTPLTY
jgi:hypothetical protein